ncbi:3-hydroxyacyl-CoA dehydrogenase NAD-binding domain-containing protein [Ruminococcus sp. OA3]|uniref:3-hydroxyacyl-CoA dehydrogenase family protein n=1 Tax=Ruminococcus sp. OA3 TaxID=2914164 RepID=UPI001F06B7E0|nr:3-hydroxyacyl-CoA dehydrogenase NAD-binding domain-containing protein [Ruminococcus sp. OA3]MCH1982418.1 3-hydroxyacyl-CoA dehydrogenase NAD-binding domain-containing protein [Ruminococcus sp. OA3]
MITGVIGSGTMGRGIALAFAQTEGYEVHFCSRKEAGAENGKEKIRQALEKRVAKGKLTQETSEKILERIKTGTKEICAQADLVIESVKEDMDTKKNLFRELETICPKGCIFATNTSALSVTEMGQDLERPIVGMHFFNPAEMMRLVEVVAGMNTPEFLVSRVTEIARSIGKTPVQVQESAGFIVNRILIPMINEGILLYANGISSAEEIDAAMKAGANHPMGPLELGDLIGLDVVLAIMEVLQNETGDSKYRPHPLLKKMVRAGQLGRKSGSGFYRYA